MFTSHTMKLPDAIEIFYSDNGPVPGSNNYTTLILIHGVAFTGHSFEKLHELSHNYSLRTVLLNRRGYYGSTKYTDEELDDLNSSRRIFLDRLSVQVAEFIRMFVEKENIPKTSADGKAGGVAVAGWSMGTATALTLFSDPGLLGHGLYQSVEPYVKDLVLYDPPCVALGYDYPPNQKTYSPWLDPDCKTHEEVFAVFGPWVSSYFTHGSTPAEFDYRKKTKKWSISSWTPEECARIINPEAAGRTEIPMFFQSMQSELKGLVRRALFDTDLCQTFFPKVKITFITPNKTVWHCIWAEMEHRRTYEEYLSRGERVRDTQFIMTEANHFLHYDDPPAFLDIIVKGVRGG